MEYSSKKVFSQGVIKEWNRMAVELIYSSTVNASKHYLVLIYNLLGDSCELLAFHSPSRALLLTTNPLI